MALLNDTKKDIKRIILETDTTVTKLAQKLGISQPVLSMTLSRNKVVTTSYIKIAEALGYDIKLVYVPREQDKE